MVKGNGSFFQGDNSLVSSKNDGKIPRISCNVKCVIIYASHNKSLNKLFLSFIITIMPEQTRERFKITSNDISMLRCHYEDKVMSILGSFGWPVAFHNWFQTSLVFVFAYKRYFVWSMPTYITCTRAVQTLYRLFIIIIKYSRTSMARTSLGPWKFVRHMGSSSHWVLIMAPVQEANSDNLGKSFRFSTQ